MYSLRIYVICPQKKCACILYSSTRLWLFLQYLIFLVLHHSVSVCHVEQKNIILALVGQNQNSTMLCIEHASIHSDAATVVT